MDDNVGRLDLQIQRDQFYQKLEAIGIEISKDWKKEMASLLDIIGVR
jgi:hypothetical protein